MNRRVESVKVTEITQELRGLYQITRNYNYHIDESDLIIFRLMGIGFVYRDIVFLDPSQAGEQAESVSS